MINRVKMCKQDYGYLRMNGEYPDMGGPPPAGAFRYFGPPISKWFPLIAVLFLMGFGCG